MKRGFQTAAALVLTLAAATAGSADTRQLAASAGIDATEAASLTLTEIARIKFNGDARQDDRAALVTPSAGGNPAARSQLIAAAGMTAGEAEGMTLTELVVAKRNRDVRRDEDIQVVVSSRTIPAYGEGARSQLIASAGVDAGAARGMTLQELYVVKINREGDNDKRVGMY